MPRADAQRNIEALLVAAEEEFAINGVSVGVRAIAARAGVTTPTLYRHFPKRSDLITAVFRRDVDACVAEATALAATQHPGTALELWLEEYADLITSKPGLAVALHTGDPAFAALPSYFQQQLGPALQGLLDTSAAAGDTRTDIDALDLLGAIAKLCIPPIGTEDRSRADRMIALLIDGMRYNTIASSSQPRSLFPHPPPIPTSRDHDS